MSVSRLLTHPGPRAEARFTALPCRAEPLTLRLAAGLPFDRAVTAAFAREGYEAGYLWMEDLWFERLAYVIPGEAPGDGRAAWYSETRVLEDAVLAEAGLHLGRRDGVAFQHCHGLWSGGEGPLLMGHLLLPESLLAEEAELRGWGLRGAQLSVAPDAETGFDLFAPGATGPCEDPNALLCTLRPNEDPHALLPRIAAEVGMEAARVLGIGSLVDTRFTSAVLDSYATEVLVRSGRVAGGEAVLDVASVGLGGVPMTGRLAPGANRICITAELLLIAE